MPFIKKEHYDMLLKANAVHLKLKVEFVRHDEFVKEHEGTFASMNSNSNFAELKSKRDLLKEILD